MPTGKSALRKVKHLQSFVSNLKDVRSLVNVYNLLRKGKKGKPSRSENVLCRSAALMLVACWESYFEDLAIGAFDKILSDVTDPLVFPEHVRNIAVDDIRLNKKDPKAIWSLAGTGWKTVLNNHQRSVIYAFSTPNTKNINKMFEDLIGLKKISSRWSRSGANATYIAGKVDSLIIMRGDIAHRGTSKGGLSGKIILNYVDMLQVLATKSSNDVGRYTQTITGKYPWPAISYKQKYH